MLPVILGSIIIAIGLAWFMGLIGGKKGSGTGSGSTTPRSTPRTPRSSDSSLSERDKKPVLIMFASQTGTAELYAKVLVREAHHLGVPAVLQDVESYSSDLLETERLVIFVAATYGEGEPTDAMKPFHDWIMDDIRTPEDELKHVKYAVFGLGDRQYKFFCQIGIELDKRMEELGAKRVFSLGTGDAGANMEEEFDVWRQQLWQGVAHHLNIALKKDTEEPVEPELKMKVWDEPEAPLPFPKMASALEPTQKLPVYATVQQNDDLLVNCPDRCTRHIILDITDTMISYQAGDHLGILPCNSDKMVQDYLDILGVDAAAASQVFSLQDKNMKNVFSARVSVRTALKWYVDLSGVPKKSTLRAFAHCCSDANEKEELLSILRVNDDAQAKYHKLAEKLRTVFGFLRKYRSCKVPIAFFLELMPRMTPRYFSIASDQLSHPKQVHVVVAVVEGGVCTSMLQQAKLGDKFPVFVRKSNFRLPLRSKTRPLIMIGPGTGVAPLIGFMHRRTQWKAKGQDIGEAMLFFGCRKKDEDHILKDFMYSCLNQGILSSLFVAYSREQTEKIYVQHLVKQHAGEIWALLAQGANVYICGDAKHMAKDVEKALVEDVIMGAGKKDKTDAEHFLAHMVKEERYLKDVWST